MEVECQKETYDRGKVRRLAEGFGIKNDLLITRVLRLLGWLY